jgi:hypothetical protein
MKASYLPKRVKISKHDNAHALKPIILFFSFISFFRDHAFLVQCMLLTLRLHTHTHTYIYIYCGNHNVKTKGVRKWEETAIEGVVVAATTAGVSN